MNFVSINPYHDYSMCLYDSNTGWFQYVKLEREIDVKHAGDQWPKNAPPDIRKESSRVLREYDFVPDAVGVALGDSGARSQNPFPRTKLKLTCHDVEDWQVDNFIGLTDPVKHRMWVDHHYAHVLSAWVAYGTDFEYGIAVDGQGTSGCTTAMYRDPFGDVETVYENRYKNYWTSSFGGCFNSVGEAMNIKGQRGDMAGKIMGAHAYGVPDSLMLGQLDFNGCIQETIHENIQNMIDDFKDEKSFENSDWRNWLATMHRIWEATLEHLIVRNVPMNASVVVSGGAAQNTVFNERIHRLYPKMEFVPHCYDGGLSFGVLYEMCRQHNQPLPTVSGFPYIQRDEVKERPSRDTIEKVAKMLADGKIVGWHQGAGEVGPRALGNRSILMNPSIPDGKDILNSKVKHREHWRPYAASVLEEHASEWFETDTPSPYMMRAIPVRKEKREQIPAVVHVDGTCRIQTVNRMQNEGFCDLIKAFYKLTNVPMLLNTSLNVGGKPISGHPDRSLALMQETKIDAVCIGDQIRENITQI